MKRAALTRNLTCDSHPSCRLVTMRERQTRAPGQLTWLMTPTKAQQRTMCSGTPTSSSWKTADTCRQEPFWG